MVVRIKQGEPEYSIELRAPNDWNKVSVKGSIKWWLRLKSKTNYDTLYEYKVAVAELYTSQAFTSLPEYVYEEDLKSAEEGWMDLYYNREAQNWHDGLVESLHDERMEWRARRDREGQDGARLIAQGLAAWKH